MVGCGITAAKIVNPSSSSMPGEESDCMPGEESDMLSHERSVWALTNYERR